MTEENFDIDDLYDETNTYTGKDQDTKTDEAKVNYEPLDSSLNLSNFDLDDDDFDEVEEDNAMAEPMESYPVLVIDDDRWIQRIFNQYLKNWGFEHINASNSYEGLDLAIKHKPLLIFLDIIMPDVTGDITLKFIRGIESISSIPVVVISGNLNKDVLKSTYKDGATGFVSKPFTKEILYEKIKEVLDPKIYNRMVNDGKIDPKLLKSNKI